MQHQNPLKNRTKRISLFAQPTAESALRGKTSSLSLARETVNNPQTLQALGESMPFEWSNHGLTIHVGGMALNFSVANIPANLKKLINIPQALLRNQQQAATLAMLGVSYYLLARSGVTATELAKEVVYRQFASFNRGSNFYGSSCYIGLDTSVLIGNDNIDLSTVLSDLKSSTYSFRYGCQYNYDQKKRECETTYTSLCDIGTQGWDDKAISPGGFEITYNDTTYAGLFIRASEPLQVGFMRCVSGGKDISLNTCMLDKLLARLNSIDHRGEKTAVVVFTWLALLCVLSIATCCVISKTRACLDKRAEDIKHRATERTHLLHMFDGKARQLVEPDDVDLEADRDREPGCWDRIKPWGRH